MGHFRPCPTQQGDFTPLFPSRGYKMFCTSSRYVTSYAFITFCFMKSVALGDNVTCCRCSLFLSNMFRHLFLPFLKFVLHISPYHSNLFYFSKTASSHISPSFKITAGCDWILSWSSLNPWRHNNERNLHSNQFSRIDQHLPHRMYVFVHPHAM